MTVVSDVALPQVYVLGSSPRLLIYRAPILQAAALHPRRPRGTREAHEPPAQAGQGTRREVRSGTSTLLNRNRPSDDCRDRARSSLEWTSQR